MHSFRTSTLLIEPTSDASDAPLANPNLPSLFWRSGVLAVNLPLPLPLFVRDAEGWVLSDVLIDHQQNQLSKAAAAWSNSHRPSRACSHAQTGAMASMRASSVAENSALSSAATASSI